MQPSFLFIDFWFALLSYIYFYSFSVIKIIYICLTMIPEMSRAEIAPHIMTLVQ